MKTPKPPEEDLRIGMMVYSTSTHRLRARIRERLSDFLVEEIIRNDVISGCRKSPFPGSYPLLLVEKRNVGTVELVGSLARELSLSPSKFVFLGLKDARSVSRQYISLKVKRLPRDLPRWVKLVGWIRRPLRREDLIGNRFEIRISVRDEGAFMSEVVSELEEKDVPNFYGYQRFGSGRAVNHIVGRALVRRNFHEAVRAFISTTGSGESEEVKKWRRGALEGGRGAIEEGKELGLLYEVLMLEEMERSGDPLRALRRVPLTLRRLFINSYQAYLFNRSVSERFSRELPISRPIKGDLAKMVGGNIGIWDGDGRGLEVPVSQLIGYSYRVLRSEQCEIEVRIMREEGINPKMFYVREMPEVSARGGIREIPLSPRELVVEERPREIFLWFYLKSGSYATVLLREILKPERPYDQGF